MINYTIAEFLGLFLIAIPFFFFVSILFFRGIIGIIEKTFFVDETDKSVFHHHFHHKDKTR